MDMTKNKLVNKLEIIARCGTKALKEATERWRAKGRSGAWNVMKTREVPGRMGQFEATMVE